MENVRGEKSKKFLRCSSGPVLKERGFGSVQAKSLCLWPRENFHAFPKGWHLYLSVGHSRLEGGTRDWPVEKLLLFLRGNSPPPPLGSRAVGPFGMSLWPGERDAVESLPRRSESWGDSLQKAACQPPLFFLSQQCYGNRGELEACQSCSPLISPVQISRHGFALSFPRLLSLLGLASMSFLSLPLSLSSYLLAITQGSRTAWVICQIREVISVCSLWSKQGEMLVRWHRSLPRDT